MLVIGKSFQVWQIQIQILEGCCILLKSVCAALLVNWVYAALGWSRSRWAHVGARWTLSPRTVLVRGSTDHSEGKMLCRWRQIREGHICQSRHKHHGALKTGTFTWAGSFCINTLISDIWPQELCQNSVLLLLEGAHQYCSHTTAISFRNECVVSSFIAGAFSSLVSSPENGHCPGPCISGFKT